MATFPPPAQPESADPETASGASRYIPEYISAGMLVAVGLLAVLWPILQTQVSQDLASSLLRLNTIPGVVLFSALIASSYPLGYMMFVLGGVVLVPFARRSLYEQFNNELSVETKAELDEIDCRFPVLDYGVYYSRPWRRYFSLIRLWLRHRHPGHYARIHSYWTRLSRAMRAFFPAFSILALCLILSTVLHVDVPDGSGTAGPDPATTAQPETGQAQQFRWVGSALPLGLAGVSFTLSAICILLYRFITYHELRSYYRTFVFLRSPGLYNLELPSRSGPPPRRTIFVYGPQMGRVGDSELFEDATVLGTGLWRAKSLAFLSATGDGPGLATAVESSRAPLFARLQFIYGLILAVPETKELTASESDPFHGYEMLSDVQVSCTRIGKYTVEAPVLPDSVRDRGIRKRPNKEDLTSILRTIRDDELIGQHALDKWRARRYALHVWRASRPAWSWQRMTRFVGRHRYAPVRRVIRNLVPEAF